ncbi:Extended synaptotagmin-2 [Colletotrichum orbiculare MAFF 240422]|uniref:Extended synaptotagmin-2 n=1 Tax=Colletotrichum orbiculare (strain 104-T / ATCC 96160 / CBS 514.97 / LARS 414 / MAFF 240422) TaxID=1213857 RepID=N4UPW8_COLOR|nr:Extended synaptotagmin-2 [Colletotrichum orbiculare MAFF 240422]
MASLVDKLTASGGSESAGFLNDIVAQLWPHINIAAGRMTKEIVEPMLAKMLPGPLASLRFAKLDLGSEPMRFSSVDVHKTDNDGIKLDMDLHWDGNCDIELEGKMVPKVGIEKVHLAGRLSILLCPLTDIIPLIGAAQVAFINPPTLKLDFTNAANIADCFLIEKTVRKVILDIVASMAVLPNRYYVKLDSGNDWFRAYQHHLGVLRLTVERATGVSGPKKSGAKRLLDKIIKDVPDCFCAVAVGAEEPWRTSVRKNDRDPVWNETHDFLVADFEQVVSLDVDDDDPVSDDDIGVASTTVKAILLEGGAHELDLTHKGEPTGAKITLRAEFHNFVSDAGALTASTSAEGGGGEEEGEGRIVGLATVLVASAAGLRGDRDELKPSVKVSWGAREFQTPVKSYSPGTDIFNPGFDSAFKMPVTADMVASPGGFKIALLNATDETGAVEVPFADVLDAPGLVKAGDFDVGGGATVRASIALRGLRHAPVN